MSISDLIEGKLTEFSANVNKSVNDINQKLLTSNDYQEQLVYNLSTLGSNQSSLIKIKSGIASFWKYNWF